MTVLTKREAWAKPRAQNETRRSDDLTPEETANVRRALRFLRTRVGGAAKLAALLKVRSAIIGKYCAKRGKPSAAMAIRVAIAAVVSVEDVLSGRWPAEGACPNCGRN
jgi:hypothetical protein